MLMQPFLASAILQGGPTWHILPAGAVVLLVFMIREPLVVLGRQALVWRGRRPESGRALRWALTEVVLLAASGLLLAQRVPWAYLLPLAGAAGFLTLAAVWMIVRNRRRSIALQIASVAGLGVSALLPPLVAQASTPAWTWWLWALLSAHNVSAVFVVHARLEMRTALRTGARAVAAEAAWQQANAAQALPVVAAVACAASGLYLAAAAPVLSAAAHGATLRTLRTPEAHRISITQVGIRALVLSLAVTAIVVAGLWRLRSGF
jgi:hypothetical protein